MKVIGFCTHFSQTDEWAFSYALDLVMAQNWQLNICHWLHSPYKIRRDIVQDDLFNPTQYLPVNAQLLVKLEFQLREYYDPKLKEFTNVGFSLCEGNYQIELVRCLRKKTLDLIIMGYQTDNHDSMLTFVKNLPYPLVLVGRDGPGSYLLTSSALTWLDSLSLPDYQWQVITEAVT